MLAGLARASQSGVQACGCQGIACLLQFACPNPPAVVNERNWSHRRRLNAWHANLSQHVPASWVVIRGLAGRRFSGVVQGRQLVVCRVIRLGPHVRQWSYGWGCWLLGSRPTPMAVRHAKVLPAMYSRIQLRYGPVVHMPPCHCRHWLLQSSLRRLPSVPAACLMPGEAWEVSQRYCLVVRGMVCPAGL